MKISKSFRFEAAHLLPNHSGKCSRLHGHSYKVDVGLEGSFQNLVGDKSSEGMLLDFGILGKIVREEVINPWDHRFLAKGDEWPCWVTPQAGEIVLLGFRTTAENLAAFIARVVVHRLKEIFPGRVLSLEVTVRVWETESSWAEDRVEIGAPLSTVLEWLYEEHP